VLGSSSMDDRYRRYFSAAERSPLMRPLTGVASCVGEPLIGALPIEIVPGQFLLAHRLISGLGLWNVRYSIQNHERARGSNVRASCGASAPPTETTQRRSGHAGTTPFAQGVLGCVGDERDPRSFVHGAARRAPVPSAQVSGDMLWRAAVDSQTETGDSVTGRKACRTPNPASDYSLSPTRCKS
jgi:hypothetical protein